jgi:hypothetical protein
LDQKSIVASILRKHLIQRIESIDVDAFLDAAGKANGTSRAQQILSKGLSSLTMANPKLLVMQHIHKMTDDEAVNIYEQIFLFSLALYQEVNLSLNDHNRATTEPTRHANHTDRENE